MSDTTNLVPEPDPRVERSRRVILEATLDELGETGYGAMTIESIARRAGVGKATVYRHWDGKLALVADALQTLKQPLVPMAEGTVRERITDLLRTLAGMISGSRWSACVPALIEAAARDDSVREFHHRFTAERRQVMIDLLQEGIDAGEIGADADPGLLAELLAGPIFYRRLMTGVCFDPAEVDEIVLRVLGPVDRPR